MVRLKRSDVLGFVLLVLLLIFVMICPTGCATAQKSEFGKHPTVWASGEHFWYSVQGYKNNNVKDYFYSQNEHWWGEPVEMKRPFKVK
jgi:hypothetical protein